MLGIFAPRDCCRSFFKKIFLFIHFYGCAGSLMLCRLFSSSGEQGPLFIGMRRLLTAVACLVAEHGCWLCRLWSLQHGVSVLAVPGLSSAGSTVVAHGLCCACGIFPDQGSNPCLLHWQADSLPLSHQGSPGSRS